MAAELVQHNSMQSPNMDLENLSMSLINSTGSNFSNAAAAHQQQQPQNDDTVKLDNMTLAFGNSSYYNTNDPINATANTLAGNIDDSNPMLRAIEELGNVLNLYYIPVLVLTGSVGNILSVLVFFKTKLSKLSSSYYLAALAISDTCFLLGLFVQWLNFVDVNIYNRENYCQFFTFFSSLACFCSSWFVVGFTVERFIAVMYPLKRQTMCTVKRAKMVLFSLTMAGILHSSPFWLSAMVVYSPQLEASICDLKADYKEWIIYLNYWDSFVVFAVPFATIAVLNTFTGLTVWKFATARRSLTMQRTRNHVKRDNSQTSDASPMYRMTSLRRQNNNSTTVTPSHENGQHDVVPMQLIEDEPEQLPEEQQQVQSEMQEDENAIQQEHPEQPEQGQQLQIQVEEEEEEQLPHQQRRHRRFDNRKRRSAAKQQSQNSTQLKVTKMLLIVSTCFIFLNLPSYLLRMKTYSETQTATNSKVTLVFQYIVQVLFITNFGINFVLYCLSGQNFRKAVMELFQRVSLTHREGNTQVTVSEYYRSGGTFTRRRNIV